jgi:subtilisin family serine protease
MRTNLKPCYIVLFIMWLAIASLLGPSWAYAQDPSDTAGGSQAGSTEQEPNTSSHYIYLPLILGSGAPVVGDPEADLTPASFEARLDWGTALTQTLTLINNGPGVLEFEVFETGGQFTPVDMVAGAPREVPPTPAQKVDAQVWAELGAASDGQTEFFVVFRDQADLRPAYAIRDWKARGDFVLQALRETAHASQSQALAQVKSFVQQGQAAVTHSYYIVNAVQVKGSAEVVEAMAARPEVAAIQPVRSHPLPELIPGQEQPRLMGGVEWNIAQIEADRVWREFGVRGEGIVVANIDTGVRYTHQALVNQYRGNLGGGHFDHNYNWWDPDKIEQQPADSHGHGTHTMGTMVGDDGGGQQIGVAPGAQWIAAQGCDGGWCVDSDLISAAEWILAPWDLTGDHDSADPSKRPHVVNNSWGGFGSDMWYMDYVNAWRAAGIFPAFSVGNDGALGCGSASSPGDYPQSFATGATDSFDLIAYFSGRGPSAFGVPKPDASAPGVDVRSAWARDDRDYYIASGTSMASPHTAGLVALMWSANEGMIGQLDETAQLLQQSALGIPDGQCGDAGPPNNVYGWGRIDAYQALAQVPRDIPWLDIEPAASRMPAHSRLPLTITLDASQVRQPGTYWATLRIKTNDPLHIQLSAPLIMTVTPHPDMSKLMGTVTSDRPGEALAGALVEVLSGATDVISGTTDASGAYGPWWLRQGSYQVVISADGYLPDTHSIQMNAGVDTTHDVELRLDAPLVQVTPPALEVNVLESWSSRQSLTLDNLGAGRLVFEITETNRALPAGPALAQPDQVGHVTVVEKSKQPVPQEGPAQGAGLAGGGPDPFGYVYRDSNDPDGPAYEWIEIAPPAGGAGTALPLTGTDEGYYWPLDLPFNFNFYGTDYTQLAVSSNGALYFQDAYLDYWNLPIPSFTAYSVGRLVAPWWDDLFVSPGAIYYQFEAGRVIVEYYQVSGWGGYDSGTWEVILYDDGNILFQYQDVAMGDFRSYGGSATVGIQGDPMTGLQYSYNTAALSAGLAICFSYPGLPTDCSGYHDVPWLSVAPASGALPGDSSLPLDVTFDATGVSPGVYTASLLLLTNDPEHRRVAVPVTMNVDACQARIAIEPSHQNGFMVAGPFTVNAVISDVADLGSFEFDLGYDPALVHVESAAVAPFLGSTGRTLYPVGPETDNGTGMVSLGAFSAGSAPGPAGTGVLASLTLSPQRVGACALDLQSAQATSSSGHPIPLCMADGEVTISECHFADFECDCDVDIADVMAVASRWGCEAGQSCYDVRYDMDADADIDVVDIMQVVPYWGWTCAGAGSFAHQSAARPATVASLRLDPAHPSAEAGDSFTVAALLDGAVDLGGFEFELRYDPGVVSVERVVMGDLLGSSGREVYSLGPQVDEGAGRLLFGGFSVGAAPGASRGGILAEITFRAQRDGDPALELGAAQLISAGGDSQPVTAPEGTTLNDLPLALP